MKQLNFKILLLSALTLTISCKDNKKSDLEDNKTVVNTETRNNKEITKNPLKNLYWGDTHLHTEISPDAFAGGARTTPEDAYRFARGEKVKASDGRPFQLRKPLDFLVVADHAEGFGLAKEILEGNEILLKDPIIKKWQSMLAKGGESSEKAGAEMPVAVANGLLSPDIFTPRVIGPIMMKTWRSYIKTADKFNSPGKFTALIGYEWSSMPTGNNLHRVVVYKDDATKAGKLLPFSAFQSNKPKDLWAFMQMYQDSVGGSMLAIPHNGNLSNGRMFPMSGLNEQPLTKAYAQLRANWEPLLEVTQIKGDSESHPFLSPEDEFASYGKSGWDKSNMAGVPSTPEMHKGSYAREALKNGMLLQESIGVNPYKFGMIGSTDSHTGLATADEDNWSGKFSNLHQKPERSKAPAKHFSLEKNKTSIIRKEWHYLASGYAAVWAESNTREDIWDAMKRKEVYGTTGSRIQLRFFGGWDFAIDDHKKPNYADLGYKRGVPMGSDLLTVNKKAPNFMIVATKDPDGANLDRVQVIKGWVKDGKTYEKIFNVVWSGDRKLNVNGKLPLVGNTVDAKKGTYTNTIGSENLSIVWTDPEFDASVKAFYYVRVLEIPTPRWTTYDSLEYNVSLDPETPLTVRERAYSSPIWYNPN